MRVPPPPLAATDDDDDDDDGGDDDFIDNGDGAAAATYRRQCRQYVPRWNYGDMLMTGRNGSAYGYRSPDVSFGFAGPVLTSPDLVRRYAAALVDWSKNRGAVYRGNRHLAVRLYCNSAGVCSS